MKTYFPLAQVAILAVSAALIGPPTACAQVKVTGYTYKLREGKTDEYEPLEGVHIMAYRKDPLFSHPKVSGKGGYFEFDVAEGLPFYVRFWAGDDKGQDRDLITELKLLAGNKGVTNTTHVTLLTASQRSYLEKLYGIPLDLRLRPGGFPEKPQPITDQPKKPDPKRPADVPKPLDLKRPAPNPTLPPKSAREPALDKKSPKVPDSPPKPAGEKPPQQDRILPPLVREELR